MSIHFLLNSLGFCCHLSIVFRQERKMFPVKLTEPLTAILYITQDREHIEELRHAIHVKEVAEAPAHEHHVIFSIFFLDFSSFFIYYNYNYFFFIDNCFTQARSSIGRSSNVVLGVCFCHYYSVSYLPL